MQRTWSGVYQMYTQHINLENFLIQKFKIVSLSLKIGSVNSSNIQNTMVMFPFSVFDPKYPSWINLVQKIKIVSLSWNLVSSLLRVCRNG